MHGQIWAKRQHCEVRCNLSGALWSVYIRWCGATDGGRCRGDGPWDGGWWAWPSARLGLLDNARVLPRTFRQFNVLSAAEECAECRKGKWKSQSVQKLAVALVWFQLWPTWLCSQTFWPKRRKSAGHIFLKHRWCISRFCRSRNKRRASTLALPSPNMPQSQQM